MDKFTPDEMLEIIVALDNESMNSKNDRERFEMIRHLKWKVFGAMVEIQKTEAAKEAA